MTTIMFHTQGMINSLATSGKTESGEYFSLSLSNSGTEVIFFADNPKTLLWALSEASEQIKGIIDHKARQKEDADHLQFQGPM